MRVRARACTPPVTETVRDIHAEAAHRCSIVRRSALARSQATLRDRINGVDTFPVTDHSFQLRTRVFNLTRPRRLITKAIQAGRTLTMPTRSDRLVDHSIPFINSADVCGFPHILTTFFTHFPRPLKKKKKWRQNCLTSSPRSLNTPGGLCDRVGHTPHCSAGISGPIM